MLQCSFQSLAEPGLSSLFLTPHRPWPVGCRKRGRRGRNWPPKFSCFRGYSSHPQSTASWKTPSQDFPAQSSWMRDPQRPQQIMKWKLFFQSLYFNGICYEAIVTKHWLEWGASRMLRHCWWKRKLERLLWETVWHYLRKLNIHLLHVLAWLPQPMAPLQFWF